jgi:hypothetical protein
VSLAFDAAGNPFIACSGHLGGPADFDLRLARWSGLVWELESVDSNGLVGLQPSLALDSTGQPWISYHDATLKLARAEAGSCSASNLRLASRDLSVTLYPGRVAAFTPGRTSAALPLDDGNDKEEPPFPLDTNLPGSAQDLLGGSDALVLYRLLGPGDFPEGNQVRLAKQAEGVALYF